MQYTIEAIVLKESNKVGTCWIPFLGSYFENAFSGAIPIGVKG